MSIINVEAASQAAAEQPGPKGKRSPIMGAIGEPRFEPTNGKVYPRTTGWGAQRTNHPDGGTRQQIAWISFPLKGCPGVTLEGRVNVERFMDKSSGKKVVQHDVTLSFLSTEPKDAAAKALVDQFRDMVLDSYFVYASQNKDKIAAVASESTRRAGTRITIEE